MTARPQGPLCLFQVAVSDQNVVGIVGRYGEYAHFRLGERCCEGGQDAGEAEIERPLHLQTAPAPFGPATRWDTFFRQDDGEFLGGAGNRPEAGVERRVGDGFIRWEAANGQPLRQYD